MPRYGSREAGTAGGCRPGARFAAAGGAAVVGGGGAVVVVVVLEVVVVRSAGARAAGSVPSGVASSPATCCGARTSARAAAAATRRRTTAPTRARTSPAECSPLGMALDPGGLLLVLDGVVVLAGQAPGRVLGPGRGVALRARLGIGRRALTQAHLLQRTRLFEAAMPTLLHEQLPGLSGTGQEEP